MSRSKSKRDEGLTSEDLKRKMYHSLQHAGVLNQLKGYLRQSVINELRGKGNENQFLEKSDLLAATIRKSGEKNWNQKALDNLILQHLKQSRYLYSLSLFQQEAGITDYNESLTDELLQRLGASPELLRSHNDNDDKENDLSMNFAAPQSSSTPDSRGIRDPQESKLLIWKILSSISSVGNLAKKVDPEAFMRETVKPRKTVSLADKLQAIDEEMDATLRERRYGDIEYRKSIATLAGATRRAEEAADKRARESLEQWKKVELTSLRVKETEKTRGLVSEKTKQLEEEYSRRKEALLQREQNAIDRLNNQKELLEKDLHQQRQLLLSELEQIRSREKALLDKEQMMRDVEAVKLKELDLMKVELLTRQGRSFDHQGHVFDHQGQASMEKSRRDSVVSSCAESLRKSLTGKESRQLDEVLKELNARSGEAEMLRRELESMKVDVARTQNQMEQHLSRQDLRTSTRPAEVSPRTEQSQSLRKRLDDLSRQLNEWKHQDKAEKEATIQSEIGRWKEEVSKLSHARDELGEKQRHLEEMTLRLHTKMNSATDKPRPSQHPSSSLRLLMDPPRDVPREHSIRDYEPVHGGHVRWADKMPYSVQGSLLDKSQRPTSHNPTNIELDDSSETTSSASSHDLSTSGLRLDIQQKFRTLEKESETLEEMYKRYIHTNYKHISSDVPRMASDIPYHRSPIPSPRYGSSNLTRSPRFKEPERTYSRKPVTSMKAESQHPKPAQRSPTRLDNLPSTSAPVLPQYKPRREKIENEGMGKVEPLAKKKETFLNKLVDHEALKENQHPNEIRSVEDEILKSSPESDEKPGSFQDAPESIEQEEEVEKRSSISSTVSSMSSGLRDDYPLPVVEKKMENPILDHPPPTRLQSSLPPISARSKLPPITSKSDDKLSSSLSDILLGSSKSPVQVEGVPATSKDSHQDVVKRSGGNDREEFHGGRAKQGLSASESFSSEESLPLKMSSLEPQKNAGIHDDLKLNLDLEKSFERPALLGQKREELKESSDQSDDLKSPSHDAKLHHSFHDDDGLQNILDSIDINSARSIEDETNPNLANLLNELEQSPIMTSQNQKAGQLGDMSSENKKTREEQKEKKEISDHTESEDEENLLSDRSVNEYSDKFLSSTSSKTESIVSEVKTMSDFEPSTTSIPRIEDKVPNLQQSVDEDEKSGAEVHWSNLQFDKSGELIPSEATKQDSEVRKGDQEEVMDIHKADDVDVFNESLSMHSFEAPSDGEGKRSSGDDFW